jgi:hypothetical protein
MHMGKWRHNCIFITDEGVWSVRVRVTLQLTVSQSVCLGVEPRLGVWSAPYPPLFTRKERSPATHCIEGFVDPRAGPDALGM